MGAACCCCDDSNNRRSGAQPGEQNTNFREELGGGGGGGRTSSGSTRNANNGTRGYNNNNNTNHQQNAFFAQFMNANNTTNSTTRTTNFAFPFHQNNCSEFRSSTTTGAAGRRANTTTTSGATAGGGGSSNSATSCPFCGKIEDPALLDGHIETCRANHRKQIRRAEDERKANIEQQERLRREKEQRERREAAEQQQQQQTSTSNQNSDQNQQQQSSGGGSTGSSNGQRTSNSSSSVSKAAQAAQRAAAGRGASSPASPASAAAPPASPPSGGNYFTGANSNTNGRSSASSYPHPSAPPPTQWQQRAAADTTTNTSTAAATGAAADGTAEEIDRDTNSDRTEISSDFRFQYDQFAGAANNDSGLGINGGVDATMGTINGDEPTTTDTTIAADTGRADVPPGLPNNTAGHHRDPDDISSVSQTPQPPAATSSSGGGGGGDGGYNFNNTDFSRQSTAAMSTDSIQNPCVICYERQYCYAFLPCGHLCVCATCASRCDECPVCREPRTGLLRIEPNDDQLRVCRSCKHVICPEFFDSHQEVCGMRMRQRGFQKNEKGQWVHPDRGSSPSSVGGAANNDNNASSRSPFTSPTETAGTGGSSRGPSGVARREETKLELEQCLNYRTCGNSRSHALVPCGHFLFCGECAEKCTSCPRCLVEPSGNIQMFGISGM